MRIVALTLIVGCSLTKSQYQAQKEETHIQAFYQYGLDFTAFIHELNELNRLTTRLKYSKTKRFRKQNKTPPCGFKIS